MTTITTTQLAALAATLAPRCGGCGALMERAEEYPHLPTWVPHGTCRPYYGAGMRVDYEAWLALVESDDLGDRAYFDTWSTGEPARGVPSWWPTAGRPSLTRYEDAHAEWCACRGCVPSLAQLAALVPEEVGA